MVVRYKDINKIKNLIKNDNLFNSYFLYDTINLNTLSKQFKIKLFLFKYFFWLFYQKYSILNFKYFLKYLKYFINLVSLVILFKKVKINYSILSFLSSKSTTVKLKLEQQKYINYLFLKKNIDILIVCSKHSLNLNNYKKKY